MNLKPFYFFRVAADLREGGAKPINISMSSSIDGFWYLYWRIENENFYNSEGQTV